MGNTSRDDSAPSAQGPKPTGIYRSFRSKLFMVTATVIIIASTALTLFFLRSQYTILHNKLATEGQLLTGLLVHNARPALFAGNSQQLADLAAGVLAVPDVLSVTISDHDGQALAHVARSYNDSKKSGMSRVITFSDKVFALEGKGNEEELLFNSSEQPEQNGQFLGTVQVVMNGEQVHAHVVRLTMGAAAVALLFLAMGLCLVYLVIRTITRPLSQLAKGVKTVERGDKIEIIPVKSNDEIGSLTASFNNMTIALQQRKEERETALRQLREVNSQLEAKVQERTHRLEETNKELESFSYSAAHDLRAPLLRLNGLCKAMKEDCGERLDEETRRYARRIATVGKQMERVISSMSTLFNVQRREMAPREIDLSAVVRTIVANLREADPLREVTVRIDPKITACGDTELLWTAMDNLVGNAWKFTSRTPDACIELGRTERGDETVFFLRDNGAGFNMAYANKLFKPFERLHTPDEFPGTGVGLAIVHRIIERHGGRIWFESAPGAGTTCYFSLPGCPQPSPENT